MTVLCDSDETGQHEFGIYCGYYARIPSLGTQILRGLIKNARPRIGVGKNNVGAEYQLEMDDPSG